MQSSSRLGQLVEMIIVNVIKTIIYEVIIINNPVWLIYLYK